jgi:kinesin family protein 2/24
MSDENEVVHIKGAKVLKMSESRGSHETEKTEDLSCFEMRYRIGEALQLRSSENTERNDQSSRSHAICQIQIMSDDGVTNGELLLVDLAGSERNYETTKMTSSQHKESSYINASLMALKDCFRMYHAQKKGLKTVRKHNRCLNPQDNTVVCRPAYRASLLTRILRQTFTSNDYRTTIIATVSPSPTDMLHSINTLRHVILMSPALQEISDGCNVTVDVPRYGSAPINLPIQEWTNQELNTWLSYVEGGRFAQLVLPPNINGSSIMRLSAENLSSLFEGEIREARQEGEGTAWVERAHARGSAALGRSLWAVLKREQAAIANRFFE